MTKLNTVAEMDVYVRRINPRSNDKLPQLLGAWSDWYKSLSWYERYISPDTARTARQRVSAIDGVRGGSRIGQESLVRGTIKKGSSGPDVEAWQKVVKVPVTGTFDSVTYDATVAYQKSKGLDSDGIVGPMTWGSVGTRKKIAVPDVLKGDMAKKIGIVLGIGVLGGIAAVAIPSGDKK